MVYQLRFPRSVSISTVNVFVGQKSTPCHYYIQNVKDGIQVYKINKENVTHFSHFISIKARKFCEALFQEKLRPCPSSRFHCLLALDDKHSANGVHLQLVIPLALCKHVTAMVLMGKIEKWQGSSVPQLNFQKILTCSSSSSQQGYEFLA